LSSGFASPFSPFSVGGLYGDLHCGMLFAVATTLALDYQLRRGGYRKEVSPYVAKVKPEDGLLVVEPRLHLTPGPCGSLTIVKFSNRTVL
jgi:hypothetical protein